MPDQITIHDYQVPDVTFEEADTIARNVFGDSMISPDFADKIRDPLARTLRQQQHTADHHSLRDRRTLRHLHPRKSDSCLAPATVHLSSEEWRRLRTFSYLAGYDYCDAHAAVLRAVIARVTR